MKVAVAIDSLLERDESIFLLELVLNLFPDSEIYTIAHKQGGILGTVETKSIVSSFLTHRAKGVDVFKKNFWVLPSAVKAIPLHHSIEKVIVLSRGYIHGLMLPENVEKFLYILDWGLVDQRRLGWQKLFSPYVNDWREKALIKYPEIAVSSRTLKRVLELPNAEVIEATYRTEEYPFVKDEDHNFLFTHHLLHTQGLSIKEFKQIAEFLLAKGEIVRVLGPDAHIQKVLAANPKLEFGGDHCEATSALYSHQAKAVWDFSVSFFPARSFGALSTGRPVVVRDSMINREFLTCSGAYFLNDVANLEEIYNQVEDSFLKLDRRTLRRVGLKWNERLFKSRMAKFLNKNS
jgi:hypothetical protein